MPTRKNLFPNPACANNGTGWASVVGTYARYAGVTLGKTADGASTSSSSSNRVWVSQASPSATGMLLSGVARLSLDAAGAAAVRMVIYADTAGEPGALLARSDEVTITHTTEQAVAFGFSGANRITVSSGTNYWVGLAWVDPGVPNVVISRDGTAAGRREQSWTYPTLPDPYGTPLTSATGPIDAYLVVAQGGLPRATGWTGTAATDSNTPRAQMTAGSAYVFSVSIHAIADQSFNMLVNFYDAASGGAFVGNSGPTVPASLTAGQTQRFVLGPYTAPAGTVSGHLKFNDIDPGGVRITAIRCSPSTGDLTRDGDYFDGDTPGAVWDGAAGDSTSTWRVFEETFALGESFSKSQTASGPVFGDPFEFGESFAIAAASTVTDTFGFVDGFLIAALSFDAGRGRVRVEAFTFVEGVIAVRVSRRPVGGTFEPVRGGQVAVLDGRMLRLVDDYEYPAGVDAEYLIEGVSDVGQVLQQATVRRGGAGDRPWLKFITDPASNQPLTLVDEPVRVERPSRASLYDVQNRSTPVVVSDVHGSRRCTIRAVTDTPAAAERLDDALRRGVPVYLQVPPDGPAPTLYATVGDYSWSPPARGSRRSIFTIPLVEVDPPPAAITEATTTWQTVLDTYPTWRDVLAQVPTWRELLA